MSRPSTFRTFVRLLLIGVLGALCFACVQRPQALIEGGLNPEFRLTGPGNIMSLTISGPDFENPAGGGQGTRYTKVYWQIEPQTDQDVPLDQLSTITYGIVPSGCKQVFPPNNMAPLPLVDDEFISFSLRLVDGQAIGKRFVIHNGKISVEGS